MYVFHDPRGGGGPQREGGREPYDAAANQEDRGKTDGGAGGTPAGGAHLGVGGGQTPPPTLSPERSGSASTLTVWPSRTSPLSSALASVSPMDVWTSRRSGRAPYSG